MIKLVPCHPQDGAEKQHEQQRQTDKHDVKPFIYNNMVD